jgi:hypothetical protein
VNACNGDISASFSVVATSATKIAYQWEVSKDIGVTWTPLSNDMVYSGVTLSTLKINAVSLSLSGSQYRCLLTNFDGTTTSNSALFTVSICSVTGTVKYNNLAKDPLSGVTVSVGGITSITNASGVYTITGVKSGSLPVIVTNNTAAGGINSTDAGSVKSWVRSPVSIPNVMFLSGDVNKDLRITNPDAAAIQNSFVNRTDFTKGPWVFWNAEGSGTVNPPTFTVAVGSTPETKLDILAMCTGDFNGSFDPDLNGNGISNLQITQTGNTLTFPSLKLFDLPLYANSDMHVGAVSLILNIPSKLVKVVNVKVTNSNVATTWKVSGDELRIGWNSISPVNVSAGEKLVVLTLLPTLAFTDIQTMTATLVPNTLNELANADFIQIQGAELQVDNVEINPLGFPNLLKLKAEPNPASVSTTFTYTLPVSGIVNMKIYNSMGSPVRSVVSNVYQESGTYSLNTDIRSLRKGIYFVKITLKNDTKYMVRTIILIKN